MIVSREPSKSGSSQKRFESFNKHLESHRLITSKGSIIDASFVDAPRQRNTHGENEQIKSGIVQEEWQPNKLRQKDVDAQWARKNGIRHYGYKNEPKVGAESKLIIGQDNVEDNRKGVSEQSVNR